jgi:translation initiation factor IF-1
MEAFDTDPARVSPRQLPATVVDLLPQGVIRVELDNREQVLAHPAAATLVNFVRLRPRDRVLVELAPGDRTRARVVKVLRSNEGPSKR